MKKIKSIGFAICFLMSWQQALCAANSSDSHTHSMWGGFSEQMKATLPLVLATSTSNVVVQAVLPPITLLINGLVATCSFVVSVGQKGFNKLCKRPNPLRASEIEIWEQVVENITGTLCEQSISGTIMLKNIPCVDDDDESGGVRGHWHYYVRFVSQVFGHIADYLESKIPYYQYNKKQRSVLVSVANSLSIEDRQGIVFMLTMIINNMRHLIDVCTAVDVPHDLDIEHVKKVSRNTLLILKKLREMVNGVYDQKNMLLKPSVSSSTATSGSSSGF